MSVAPLINDDSCEAHRVVHQIYHRSRIAGSMPINDIKKYTTVSALAIVPSLCSLLFNLFLVNKLGMEIHGLYSLALVYSSFGTQLALFGTSELMVRYLHQNESYFLLILRLRALFAFTIIIICLLSSLFFNNEVALYAALGILTGMGFSSVFEYVDRIERYSFLFAMQRVLFFIVAGFFVQISDTNSVLAVLVILFAIDASSLLWQWAFLSKKMVFNTGPLKAGIILREGFDVTVLIIGKLAIGSSVRFAIPVLGSIAMLSLFSFTWQFLTFSSLLNLQATRVFRNRIYKLRKAGIPIGREVMSYCRFTFFFSACLASLLLFFGEQLLTFALPNSLEDVGRYILPVSVYIIVIAGDSLINVFVVMLGLTGLSRNIYACCGLLILCLLPILSATSITDVQFLWAVCFVHLLIVTGLTFKVRNAFQIRK